MAALARVRPLVDESPKTFVTRVGRHWTGLCESEEATMGA